MNVMMVAVVSNDGFITRGNDPNPSSWSSKEDQQYYDKLKSKHKLHVMGSSTFEACKDYLDKNVKTVVLTSDPDRYVDSKEDYVEFRNLNAKEFVEEYKNLYESCLVLGGSRIYNDFLANSFVDEAIITTEPINLKSGIKFLNDNKTLEDFGLKEQSVIKLNRSVTILSTYIKN